MKMMFNWNNYRKYGEKMYNKFPENKFLRFAICEDKEYEARQIAEFISLSGLNEFQTDIIYFSSGEEFLSSPMFKQFDVVFLDIYMGDGITGIETAKHLRCADDSCVIIFITSSEDYALDAFRVNASQYLVKPIKQEEVSVVLRKSLNIDDCKNGEMVSLNLRGIPYEIPAKNIIYVEAQNHNCLIHTKKWILETGSSMKLKNLEQLLQPPQFLFCHRSYIINLSYVEEIDRELNVFRMWGGGLAYIRKGGLPECSRAYTSWLFKETEEIAGGRKKL